MERSIQLSKYINQWLFIVTKSFTQTYYSRKRAPTYFLYLSPPLMFISPLMLASSPISILVWFQNLYRKHADQDAISYGRVTNQTVFKSFKIWQICLSRTFDTSAWESRISCSCAEVVYDNCRSWIIYVSIFRIVLVVTLRFPLIS